MIKKLLIAAALAAPVTLAATAATAQVGGVAVADPEAAIAGSKAFTAGQAQINATYKTQIDQAEARRQQIIAELQPQATALQTAANAPNANQASIQTQAAALQSRQQAAQAELSRLTAPAARAQSYMVEQIQAKLPDAVNNVVRAKNVSLLLRPQATLIATPAADITAAISAELDRTITAPVSTTPPANWQPGQAGQAAATTPAAPTRRSQGR